MMELKNTGNFIEKGVTSWVEHLYNNLEEIYALVLISTDSDLNNQSIHLKKDSSLRINN